MRCDLHVHSRYSGMLGLRLLGGAARECYSDPFEVRAVARARGMDIVTLTDHDSIDGALLLLARHDDVFVSEEVTCTLPGGRQIHVGVFGLDLVQHARIERLRNDAEAFFAYLSEQRLPACFNHPFAALTGPRETRDLRIGLRGLPLLETRNGMLPQAVNECAREVARAVAIPAVGGSDAHTLRSVARAYTEVPGARDKASFLDGLRRGSCLPRGRAGGWAQLAADVARIFASHCSEAACRAAERPLALPALGLALLGVSLLPLLPAVTAAIAARDVLFARRHLVALLGEPSRVRTRRLGPPPGTTKVALEARQ